MISTRLIALKMKELHYYSMDWYDTRFYFNASISERVLSADNNERQDSWSVDRSSWITYSI